MQTRSPPTRAVLLHALPIAVFVLALFTYWFAFADRYILFLYYHDMGPLVPDTAPFNRVTASRYWMAGLVAGGIVMTLYTSACWLLGRLVEGYRPPPWWKVWGASSVPLLAGIPLITMSVNNPTLPLWHAALTTLSTVLGLGLALTPGRMAAERPWALALLSLDGWAIAGILLSVAMLERVAWLWGRGGSWIWSLLVVGAGFMGAVVLLLVLTGVRLWRRWPIPPARSVFVAGLCVAHLLLAEMHHLFFTDGYFYITDMDNFFSRSWLLQAISWIVAGAISAGVTRLRERLAARATERAQGPPVP